MDSRTFALLEHIVELCGDRPLLIVEVEDLVVKGIDADSLPALTEALATEGYIERKYADGGEYCLGPTAQGRQLVMEVRDERTRRKMAEDKRRADSKRKSAPILPREAPQKVVQMVDEEEVVAETAADTSDKKGNAAAPADAQASDKPADGSISRLTREGRTVLMMWLAAFLGALLGGGIVGLVMYILHVTLH